MKEDKQHYKSMKVTPDVHQKLKVLSAQVGKTISETISSLLDNKTLWEKVSA